MRSEDRYAAERIHARRAPDEPAVSAARALLHKKVGKKRRREIYWALFDALERPRNFLPLFELERAVILADMQKAAAGLTAGQFADGAKSIAALAKAKP